MKLVYFVRHGLTNFNIQNKIQDHADELSEQGIEQAKAIADRLSRVQFDVLLSSTMTRARQTAERIAERTGHTPEFFPVFSEARYPSSLVGLSREEKLVQDYFQAQKGNGGDLSWQYQDEESPRMLRERAQDALMFLASRAEDSAVVVTHGRFLRYVLLNVLVGDILSWQGEALALGRMATSNTGISVFEYDGADWRLITWNDHAHLG